MNPTVVAILADERHSELLRAAESRRRVVAHARGSRSPLWAGVTTGFARAFARVQRPSASWQTSAESCCA